MPRAIGIAVLAQVGAAAAYSLVPRWGHGTAYISNPPTLVLQGGKTDTNSFYTYSSAPNSPDTILVPLDSAFNTAAPPATLVSDAGPNYTWHCLAPLDTSSTGVTSLLSFGGDGGWALASDTSADSAWLLSIDSGSNNYTFTHEATGWADEPTRRVQSSCASAHNAAFITGGTSGDGSSTPYSEVYMFNATTSTFTALSALPLALYHHVSVLLTNGTLVVFGGVYISPETANPTLSTSLYTLDTTSSTAEWNTLTINGTTPTKRRGASVTLNDNGMIFIFGGANVDLTEVYGDGWLLNPTNLVFTEVLTSSTGPGARFDHSGIAVGGEQVIVFGGPADASIHIVGLSGSTVPSTGVTSSAQDVVTFIPTVASSDGTAVASGMSALATGTAQTASGGSAASQSGTAAASGDLTHSTADSPSATATNSHDKSFSTTRLIALVSAVGGSVLLIFLVLLILLWRRRKNRLSGRGNERVYSEKGEGKISLIADPEKGTPPDTSAIPDAPEPSQSRSKEAITALGVGLSRAVTKIHRKVSGGPNEEYSQLKNEPLKRRSTRRVGTGIRLIGVTPDIDDIWSDDENDFARPSAAQVGGSRRAMLQDEDTRRFSVDADIANRFSSIPEEEASVWKRDFAIDGGDLTKWRTAESLLDYSSSSRKYIRGGPVPTPVESLRGPPLNTPNQSQLDMSRLRPSNSKGSMESLSPSDAISSRGIKAISKFLGEFSEPPALELDPFLVAVANGGRLNSRVPVSTSHGSQSSPQSAESLNDLDSAMISGAKHVEQLPSASPSLVPGVSIGRTAGATFGWEEESDLADLPQSRPANAPRHSLLRRISSNIKARALGERTTPSPPLDIRDPNPPPTDWPLSSLQTSTSSSATWSSVSPSAEIYPPAPTGKRMPSLTEVGSVRSMRDLEVVQRDVSNSSDQGVLESLLPSAPNSDVSDLGLGLPTSFDRTRPLAHQRVSDGSIPITEDLGLEEFGPSSPRRSRNTTPCATPLRVVSPVSTVTPHRTVSSPYPLELLLSPASRTVTPSSAMLDPFHDEAEEESSPLVPPSPSTTSASTTSASTTSASMYATPPSSPLIRPNTVTSATTPTSVRSISTSVGASGSGGSTLSSTSSAIPSWAPLKTRTPSRRPVIDIVASINKRGGGVPSLFSHESPNGESTEGSPLRSSSHSFASPSPAYAAAREALGLPPSPSTRRLQQQYDTVPRSPLRVANPDKDRSETP